MLVQERKVYRTCGMLSTWRLVFIVKISKPI